MNNFSWAKALGYGAIIWVVLFLAALVLASSGVTIGIGWGLALAALALVLSYIFAIYDGAQSTAQAFGYGAVWAAVGLLLDLIVSHQLQGNIFSIWSYWLGYALVLFAPWIEYEIQGKSADNPRAI